MALALALLSGCRPGNGDSETPVEQPLFTLLPPETTHVAFSNTLREGLNTNILMYEYFYNGGGVAAGDLNDDGLVDLYFTSNMEENKLYLNQSNFVFEDITKVSGAGGRAGPWKTGVTLVDINGDHKIDIYLCYSGQVKTESRANQLFINMGNDGKGIPHFQERAHAYGLDSKAYSNQGYFFDYDRDGDLDMLLLNHNPKSLPVLNEVSTVKLLREDEPLMGVRLYRQTNNHFDDVTRSAGISGSALTYGLGIGISDFNNDGWPDFYTSNDYAVPDYLYINNGNGTFSDKAKECLGHTSHFSMGNDVGDINNDGLSDIITLDMLPADPYRQKLLLAPDNYAKFDLNVRSGFHYQYMRNMLQVNNGNGTFSEVGQLAGISNTDWSWAALLADYDNDGWKDLFVTNGYVRDYTNQDFIKYMDDFVKARGRLKREDVLEIIQHMPSSDVVNFIFKNDGGVTFSDQTGRWGMTRPSNSNGAAYADLDNDGDLDVIVSNINEAAFVYQNTGREQKQHHYLQIKLRGGKLNSYGIGTKVMIVHGGQKQYQEHYASRGYLSAVSPVLHFGLGNSVVVDSLVVAWPGGGEQTLYNIKTDQVLTLEEGNANKVWEGPGAPDPWFQEVQSPISHHTKTKQVNDFKRQPLLLHQLSDVGSCLASADVNHDGLQDVYVSGGGGEAAALFMQQKDKQYVPKRQPAFEEDREYYDADAVFFDANSDGHPDLYVATGGYHYFSPHDEWLQDRLYINDGTGTFTKAKSSLPEMRLSKGCVAAGDVNHDGAPDVFVGGRVIPGRYPEAPASYLLINDGKGNYKNQIETLAPDLSHFGIIKAAVWTDMNGDGREDLIVAGEWLPVSIFINENGRLKNKTHQYFERSDFGFWKTLGVGDFNQDGKPDIIAGNNGTNIQFRASVEEPLELYYTDYDNNGSVDPMFCFTIRGKRYPFITRDEMLEQVGSLRSRYNSYQSYASASIQDVFRGEELSRFTKLTVDRLETTLFLSQPSGKYTMAPLPLEAQYGPVNAVAILDFDDDGHQDVLLCGNNYKAKLRLGRSDANYGVLLRGDGRGGFEYIPQTMSGFKLRGEVSDIMELNDQLLFSIAGEPLVSYRLLHSNKVLR